MPIKRDGSQIHARKRHTFCSSEGCVPRKARASLVSMNLSRVRCRRTVGSGNRIVKPFGKVGFACRSRRRTAYTPPPKKILLMVQRRRTGSHRATFVAFLMAHLPPTLIHKICFVCLREQSFISSLKKPDGCFHDRHCRSGVVTSNVWLVDVKPTVEALEIGF